MKYVKQIAIIAGLLIGIYVIMYFFTPDQVTSVVKRLTFMTTS